MLTGLISSLFGPAFGGLFLAIPAIFCASATLIEKHEIQRKRSRWLRGERRGRQAAAVDAAGATLSSLGMIGFAATFYRLADANLYGAFVAACLAWSIISVGAW